MNAEEKLYTLMAQAEDIQGHAVKLQNKAEETFKALPEAVEASTKKIRSTALYWVIFSVLCVVLLTLLSYFIFVFWSGSLRDEVKELQAEIHRLENLREFTPAPVLSRCDGRPCIKINPTAPAYGEKGEKGEYRILFGH